jgi:hypothetical protein
MSSTQRSTLKWTGHEPGIAIAAEYVLLLGVSLLIFMAIFIGFNSFINTASADATSEAAYHVAVQVSEFMSDAAESEASVTERIDLPGRICGQSYVICPSNGGRAICVLVNGNAYEAPVIAPADVKLDGFMVSLPCTHRIDYDISSKTLTMT